MRKKQENKYTMMKAVEAFLDERQNIVSSIAELQQHHNSLKTLCVLIALKEKEKRTILTGKSLRKLSEKNDVIKKAMAMSGAIYAYATKTNSIELAEVTDVFRSDLSRLRDTELIGVLKTLKDLATEHQPALEPYGITIDKLNAFSEKIRLYETAVGQSETGSAIRSGAVMSLKTMFQEADKLLTSLDRLVNGLAEEFPDFVRDYYIARPIKNLGIRHRKEELSENQGSPPGNQGSPPGNQGGPLGNTGS